MVQFNANLGLNKVDLTAAAKVEVDKPQEEQSKTKLQAVYYENNIGNVQEGDYIIGEDGRARKVKFDKKTGELYINNRSRGVSQETAWKRSGSVERGIMPREVRNW